VRVDDLRQYIRDIPNFPTEGVIFRDITPLLKNPDAFATTVDLMAEAVSSLNVHCCSRCGSSWVHMGWYFGLPSGCGFHSH